MAPIHRPDHYQVAIIGGGPAGLTLALACERFGIEYALFESQATLSPNSGASVGIMPNGLRILDQLDVLKVVNRYAVALKTWRHFDQNGKLLCANNAWGHYKSKIGYQQALLSRQEFLESLSSQLHGKGLIKTSCKVTSLKEEDDIVTVTTTDGFTITADLVIGADGVRSCVRKHICSSQTEASLQTDDDMSIRFAGVYGMSTPTTGILEGECFTTYCEGSSVFGLTGKNNIVYWFICEDLGQNYSLSKSPRYTAADADILCKSVGHLHVAPNLTFSEVYANKTFSIKVPLEEGIAKVWHTDRTVLVGDAAHKMVPHTAAGAGQAMESCVLLLNELGPILKSSQGGKIPSKALRAAFARYSAQRIPRSTQFQQLAGTLAAGQLLKEEGEAMVKELPTLTDGDWMFKAFALLLAAPVVDGIPPSSTAKLYHESLASFMQRFQTRKYSNMEVFGLTE